MMRDRSREVGEARPPSRRPWTLAIALGVLGCLWLGMGGCSDGDITFPGDVPPRPSAQATAEPTATPDDDGF